MAVKAGVPIVPVYVFGHTRLFTQPEFAPDSPVAKLSRKLSMCGNRSAARVLSARRSLTLFWGRFYLPIPERTNITVAVGTPIPTVKTEHPTPEQIDTYHALYLQELERLYHKHKAEAGYGSIPIRFV